MANCLCSREQLDTSQQHLLMISEASPEILSRDAVVTEEQTSLKIFVEQ